MVCLPAGNESITACPLSLVTTTFPASAVTDTPGNTDPVALSFISARNISWAEAGAKQAQLKKTSIQFFM
jgi:hypothetical protein